jgi:excinuclease ABC subunit C
MQKAAAQLDFEKAAQLRDAIADLKRTTQKTEKFERIPYKLPIAINPEADLRELARVLNLPAVPARIEGFDISNISGTFMVASMVSFWHGRPDRANYRRFKMKSVVRQDDFACMAETIQRRYSRLLRELQRGSPERGDADTSGGAAPQELQRAVDDISGAFGGRRPRIDTDAAAQRLLQRRRPRLGSTAPSINRAPEAIPDGTEAIDPDEPGELSQEPAVPWVPRPPTRPFLPDLILIDGGKGQLNAALTELARLGLDTIPVIGLAKEYEEIHRPGVRDPLRLGLDSPAVKLLQRVRDEAHRFANTFNAQLRLKKISESLLDEFPGIGEARKQALLKKFGSIQRLRLASVEEIAAVPGFGGSTAERLRAFLLARASDTHGDPSESNTPAPG